MEVYHNENEKYRLMIQRQREKTAIWKIAHKDEIALKNKVLYAERFKEKRKTDERYKIAQYEANKRYLAKKKILKEQNKEQEKQQQLPINLGAV